MDINVRQQLKEAVTDEEMNKRKKLEVSEQLMRMTQTEYDLRCQLCTDHYFLVKEQRKNIYKMGSSDPENLVGQTGKILWEQTIRYNPHTVEFVNYFRASIGDKLWRYERSENRVLPIPKDLADYIPSVWAIFNRYKVERGMTEEEAPSTYELREYSPFRELIDQTQINEDRLLLAWKNSQPPDSLDRQVNDDEENPIFVKDVHAVSYDPTERLDYKIDLNDFTNRLSGDHRKAFIMNRQGYNKTEIGKELGVSPTTVGNWVAKHWEDFNREQAL